LVRHLPTWSTEVQVRVVTREANFWEGLPLPCRTGAGSTASRLTTDEAASPDARVWSCANIPGTGSGFIVLVKRGSVGWKVENPQGVEGTLRSTFQARSDRYPGPLDGEEVAERRATSGRKRKRGGQTPNDRVGIPRRGEGQESIGLVSG
jgi:hypothetical protein